MNGSIVNSSETGVRTNGTFGVIRNSWLDTVEYRFTDFVFYSLIDMMNAQSSAGGSYTGTGRVEVVGIGEFTVDYSVTEFGLCESERDELILGMNGDLETISYTQSSDSCDGCTDWSTSSRSGTICD